MPVLPQRHLVAVDECDRMVDAGVFAPSDISRPQPDVALLVPRDDYYAEGHPGPSDVLLVVEVADTGVRFDRATKLPAYGRAAWSRPGSSISTGAWSTWPPGRRSRATGTSPASPGTAR